MANRHPPASPAMVGRVSAAAAEPKLPQPPYTPSAVPISSDGNHSLTMRMPTTNPAPMIDMARRDATSTSKDWAVANTSVGTAAYSRIAA